MTRSKALSDFRRVWIKVAEIEEEREKERDGFKKKVSHHVHTCLRFVTCGTDEIAWCIKSSSSAICWTKFLMQRILPDPPKASRLIYAGSTGRKVESDFVSKLEIQDCCKVESQTGVKIKRFHGYLKPLAAILTNISRCLVTKIETKQVEIFTTLESL